MKKITALLCTAVIAGMPFTTVALASGDNDANQAEEVQNEQGSTSEDVQNEDVKILTLDDVVKRALDNDQNLVVLQYELEALKNQTLDAVDDMRDTQKDIRDLEKKLDKLKDERDRLTGLERLANGQERVAISDALELLDDKITALETAIKQLESGQFQLNLQAEEVKEGISLKLTSTYVNLLNLQKQMNFTQKAIQTAINEVKKAEKLYQYGAGSKEAVDQAKRQQVDLEKQLEQLQKNYYYNLANLSFDININYNPDLYLTPVDMEIASITKIEDYDSVIEGTFQMKRAKDNLELAKYHRDVAYEDEDASEFLKAEKDYKVKAAEETINKLYKELTTKIDALNHNADLAELNYEEAVRKLENVKTDLANLEKRYNAGVVSKYDYEKAKLQLEQALLNVELAKAARFLVQQSIEALEKGYIQ
ncbi:outer membrane protein TolC [Anoxybacillus vitaminiphilus]|uniref:Outer membrane protein TolC n=1 Tax=Paranoxybacillus vitaminiphilus TaxID=581036 RepID=A0A327YFQ2_9BACL|nr:TolC family protein [Anoxybacillus vitaminiphilus]RAK19860.1 outer membrane protein TolC [Anoxybacillus vitaminiphilus]